MVRFRLSNIHAQYEGCIHSVESRLFLILGMPYAGAAASHKQHFDRTRSVVIPFTAVILDFDSKSEYDAVDKIEIGDDQRSVQDGAVV